MTPKLAGSPAQLAAPLRLFTSRERAGAYAARILFLGAQPPVADTSYLTGVALPMILIGIGQGAALSPLLALAVVVALVVRPRSAAAG